MLINLRNALMAGKWLPYDAEVEYLESTGTQWIDTGYIATEDTRVVATLYTTETGNKNWFGGSSAAPTLGFNLNSYSASSLEVRFGNSNWQILSAQNVVGSIFAIDFGKDAVKVNGSTIYTPAYTLFRGQDVPIAIFVRYGGSAYIKGRVYSFQIYENGVLVRDYIPVRVGTVGYLYDRVSGKLFGNAGTGDFVLGQDVVPVEYIESHGTEYIDTGVVSTSSSTWVCDCAIDYTAGTASAYIGQTYKTASGGGSPRFTFGRTRSTNRWYCGIGNLNSGTEMPVSDGNRHTFTLDAPNKAFKVDSNSYAMNWSTFVLPTTIGCGLGLFARSYLDTNGEASAFAAMRLWSSRHYSAGELANNFLPVRVGTEGAMMDVLTRRVYRNAGTGAFGYGNDLKYPIPAS